MKIGDPGVNEAYSDGLDGERYRELLRKAVETSGVDAASVEFGIRDGRFIVIATAKDKVSEVELATAAGVEFERIMSGEISALIAERNNAIAERDEALTELRCYRDVDRFANLDENATGELIDKMAEESTEMSHAELAAHYACAIANWNSALDERGDAVEWLKLLDSQMFRCECCGLHRIAEEPGEKKHRDGCEVARIVGRGEG